MTELDPAEGPPPRTVHAWTQVAGHTYVRRPDRSFCSCGWANDGSRAGQRIEDHLRDAWPILVPRGEGEARSVWRDRVALAHADAPRERERLWNKYGMGNPVLPGQPFPVITRDYARADERVQVLEWQLEQIPWTF